MKSNVQKIIRSFYVGWMKSGSNEIEYDEGSDQDKIAVFDSELLRIVEAADAENSSIYLPGLISLKIGWSTSVYREMTKKYGGKLVLKHVKRVNINKGKKDEEGKELPREYEYQQVLDKEGNQVQEVFVRLIAGSSQGRAKKAFYIREDLYEDVNKVLLSGMNELKQNNGFPAFSGGYAKWNAYYGLASTDSVAMDYVPRIVVVRDFEREVTDTFDVLKPYAHTYPGKEPLVSTEYEVENNVERTISIKPFDGAGLVSVECAKKWAQQLGLDLNSQLPAAFQIRAIPGIKGNLYTFDIKKFGRRSGRKIKDILYDPADPDREKHMHDPEQVDVILTESQFKFLKMYGCDPECWREQFEQPVLLKNGKKYRRTFNISEYASGEAEVKSRVRTAYQHWQTIHNTEKECGRVSHDTLKQLERISTDVNAFLKYRCYVEEGEDPEDSEWGRVLPYYRAAYKMDPKNRQILFADPYFQKKAERDLEGAYRRALLGKLSIVGNYQYLTPDIFALAQHSFGMEVTGLLPAGMIYSNWWLRQDEKAQDQAYNEAYDSGREVDLKLRDRYRCEELALIRNPHIYMEARIARMASGKNVGWPRYDAMEDWYQYQTTGIVTDSYSTIPLALGTADFDGDTIITTNCSEYIVGVERALRSGRGNTLWLEREKEEIPPAEDVTDMSKLLEADINTYENDIGTVVNRVTSLWGCPFEGLDEKISIKARNNKTKKSGEDTESSENTGNDEETEGSENTENDEGTEGSESDNNGTVRDYIKTMAVIGQLTIDAAKTGEVPEIPKNIQSYCERSKLRKPRFLRYQVKKNKIPKEEDQIGTIEQNANNMDRFCNLVEKRLVMIQRQKKKPELQFSTELFLKFFLLGDKPAEDTPFFGEARRKLRELAGKNNRLHRFLAKINEEDEASHYRYLYDRAGEEFLGIAKEHGVSRDELLDCLIYLGYTDDELLENDGAKNVLWNVFEDEMVERAERNTFSEADFSGLDEDVAGILRQIKEAEKEKRKEREAEPLHIRVLEDKKKSYRRIEIHQSELELIFRTIPGEQLEDRQLRRLYAVLMVIYKYWGKVVVKKGGNNDLTRTKLAILCNMKSQRKVIYEKMKKLHEIGAIEMDDSVENNIKIKVVCSPSKEGEVLIDTDDYMQACEEIIRLTMKALEVEKKNSGKNASGENQSDKNR